MNAQGPKVEKARVRREMTKARAREISKARAREIPKVGAKARGQE